MLLIPHINKPNMVARVAGVLGSDNVNISGMQVVMGQENKSIMIINIDSKVNPETLDKITAIEGIDSAKYINLL